MKVCSCFRKCKLALLCRGAYRRILWSWESVILRLQFFPFCTIYAICRRFLRGKILCDIMIGLGKLTGLLPGLRGQKGRPVGPGQRDQCEAEKNEMKNIKLHNLCP